jgi:hypothetical protein
MPMDRVANDLPGNSYTMHPTAGPNVVDIPDRITDSVMIEIDPVFQMRSMAVPGMVNRLEIVASEKNGNFAGINPVIFIAFAGDQLVAARLRDDEFLDLLVEVTVNRERGGMSGQRDCSPLTCEELYAGHGNPCRWNRG